MVIHAHGLFLDLGSSTGLSVSLIGLTLTLKLLCGRFAEWQKPPCLALADYFISTHGVPIAYSPYGMTQLFDSSIDMRSILTRCVTSLATTLFHS